VVVRLLDQYAEADNHARARVEDDFNEWTMNSNTKNIVQVRTYKYSVLNY